EENRAGRLRRVVRWRHQADVVAAASLELQHHLGQPLDRDDVLLLPRIVLADLIVLAINAAQIAVSEKDISRAAGSRERRLLAKMSRVGRDDGIGPRRAGREDVLQPVVSAIARAYGARSQKRVQALNALRELPARQQGHVSRFLHGGSA